ncbi:AraC family transcriptional regulator [Aquincola sp. S2]|uniref:AraC family transcriptional regulator n=1 Tax=Pseudaquabacterium terrae TaxID=2732868 RepID=A0ABX2ENU8_9BURK|nr:AraC family transcriptional regulator [Aquabacterium terrae]NRF70243.1 AraC family transcriptional regulator [Aquabacterium terrae]
MRQRQPELEVSVHRSPLLGYEPPPMRGACLHYLEHGYPSPLVRWHCHDEYELHLIEATSGRMFVGNHIGHFEPGQLVLTGPRLPHNWISTDCPPDGVAVRDRVIQFAHAPIAHAARQLPELAEALPLLERARHGLEFPGFAERASLAFQRIKACSGLKRFGEFCLLLAELAACTQVRVLSSVQLQIGDDEAAQRRIHELIAYVNEHCAEPLALPALCRRFAMSESRFTRLFRRATGHTLTDFVNRLRINRACQLLMDTQLFVTGICYEVGFNNVANFNRRFLEIKGMTPTEFRRRAEARFGTRAAGPAS